ncbi:MFS transporter [Amycolatopsis sp. K13G38]|uniref:MFS transporter n=1 Tax=Amycolatopsis acididurans TaxID=2724524 RepID=A0ABX1JCS6_9PSEU|nr:MFS transporter [Amycolatopsis acididurans]NKQ56077.1 MFS transporter [Amycolatopsis acididurans]
MTSTARLTSTGRTFAVLAAGAGSFAVLQSLISPVLSTIQHDLHTDQSTVTWLQTGYLLSASIFTPILGRIGDMVGKQRTLVATLAVLALGCLLAAVAPNITVLLVARTIQGAGGAVFPLSFGIIRDEFPSERVSATVGTISAIIAAGGGLGIVLAGPIVSSLGRHWLFWIPTIVVSLTAVAARWCVPESPVRTAGRVNWPAAALLTSWLIALLLPVSKAAAWGWGSARVIGLLIIAAALLAGWIAVETRSANPLIDMRMMRLPAVWPTNLVALLFGAAMFAVLAFVPVFTQAPTSAGYGFGSSVTESGLLMLPMLVCMFIAGFLSGRVDRLFSPKAQLVTCSALSVVACAVLALAHHERWQIAVAVGTLGLGIGLAFSAMANLIVRNVPAHQTGVATGMNANIRTIGGAIGTAAMTSVVTAHPGQGGIARETGFVAGFVLLTVISVVAVAAAIAVRTVGHGAATLAPATER